MMIKWMNLLFLSGGKFVLTLPGMETTAVGTTSAGSLLNPASSFGLCTFKISLKYLCSVGISAGDKISFRQ